MDMSFYFLLDNIYVKFGTSIYEQVFCIPTGPFYAHLVTDLILYFHERSFIYSLSLEHEIITLRYFDYLFNVDG